MHRLLRRLPLLFALAAPLALAKAPPQKKDAAAPAEAEKKADAPVPDNPNGKEAQALLVQYLDAVKAKKWADAKKITHPKTLTSIAERKKRLGDEDHPMAPWYYAKATSYLKAYTIKSAHQGPFGTWIFEVSEDNFQIQEKGVSEGDQASYLVGRSGGKWYVVDKKRQVTFSDDAVKLGYKGYFDTTHEDTGKPDGEEE